MKSGRKRQRYQFDGSPTTNPSALPGALGHVTSVRITQGGYLIYALDPEDDVLSDRTRKFVSVVDSGEEVSIAAPEAVGDLVRSLEVIEVTDFLCMCTGDLAIEFFDEDRRLVSVVRVDLPGRIEWPHWPGIAHLARPERLNAWIERHAESLLPAR